MLRVVLLVLFMFSLPGCYYLQAAKGQLDLNRKREPIEDVLQDEGTPPELAARLRLVQEARQFSIDVLKLPDNDSYRSYADLGRDYVVWNVFAAPEFSLQPKTWCYPVAGCVAYRGYFSKDAAKRKAERLEKKGYDVAVGGVPAYSTLGKFSDPVLNTMMHWDDVQLIGVLFHELAHQLLYVQDDSGFNESFASAVQEFGLELWLEKRGRQEEMQGYLERRELNGKVMELVTAARSDLESIYDSELPDERKRSDKMSRLDSLSADIAELLMRDGAEGVTWVGGDLNNARLATLSVYEGRLPEFRALYERCEQRIECFYDEAKALAGR